MDIKEIRELIDIVNESDIAELVIKDDGEELVIKKPAACQGVVAAVPAAPPAASARQEVLAPAEPATQAPSESVPENHVTVVAPMVGTFYTAPAPDAPAYVKVGDTVKTGQPLCIIEAMKLMNEIEAEVSGRIVKVLVENAQPVEYGQPLFVIEKE